MKIEKYALFIVFYYLFYLLIFIHNKKFSNNLMIRIIDVGQGDAVLIRSPEGRIMLIDGGENFEADRDIASQMFYPFCYIEKIFITHSHFDHYGGIGKIYDRCTVAQVMFNDISTGTSSWEALKEKFKNNSEENSFIGDEYLLGSVYLKILWPGKDILEKRVKNLNNTSLVIFLDYKDYEALFLGDLEVDALKEIDISDITGLIQGKLDLLKVSHHGSNTGSYRPLVEQLDTIYCVISVGKDNKFNHPHKEALESYEELGCKVLRTDIEGDIVIKTE